MMINHPVSLPALLRREQAGRPRGREGTESLNHEWTPINTNGDAAYGGGNVNSLGILPAGISVSGSLNGEGKEKNHGLMLRGAGKVRNWVIGCDVAKHTDFTVLVAMDAETGRCYGMERFNQLDWPIQKERILGFCQRYPGRLILDATGIGDPIYDDLKRVWSDIEGFKLTAGSKTELIQRLIVAVEQRRVCWPGGKMMNHPASPPRGPEVTEEKEAASGNVAGISVSSATRNTGNGCLNGDRTEKDSSGRGLCGSSEAGGSALWDVLTNEMKRYEYEISRAGRISYNAPSGYHDDCVIALALANHGRWKTGNCGRMLRVAGPRTEDGGLRVRGRRRTTGFRRRPRVMLG